MASVAPSPSSSALRRTMVDIGRRLYDRGLVVAMEGNLSARLADGTILMTPTGMCKGRLTPGDLIVVDAAGSRLKGTRTPSTELRMHIIVLKARPDVGACVHAHPPYATAFAVAGIALTDSVLPEVITTLGAIPLAEYATPSTPAVGASIEKYLDHADAFLLKNHGVLTIGTDLEDAFYKMETVERCAQIVHLARGLGGVDTLTKDQVEELRTLAGAAGSPRGGSARPARGNRRTGTPPRTTTKM